MSGPDLTGHRLGGFELTEELGAGASASVWKARQLRLGRDVAVKILDPVVARNADAARRFEREGRSAASLDHPHIVPIYEAGEADGLVYLAMRLVDGRTLEDVLERGGRRTLDETIEILAQVASALDHAHSRQLTHRDVKPSNILIDDEQVWLADFGIAASTHDIGRYTVGSIGTAEYMAPEQAAQGELDHRADLYALGCVAHHCLVGQPPFTGDELVPVMMDHVNTPVPKQGHEGFDAFMARALAKNPDDRFQSGAAFIEALEALRDAPSSTTGTATTETAPDHTAPADAVEEQPPHADPAAKRGRNLVPLALGAVLAVGVVVAVVIALAGGDDPDNTVAGLTDEASEEPEDTDGPTSETGDDGSETQEQEPTPEDTEQSAGATTDDAGDDGTAVATVSGGLAVVGTNQPLASLNPHTDFNAAGYLSGYVYPTMVNVNDDFSLAPNLASELPELVSVDPQTVRWTLRSDATWNDGTPITSTDVRATYDYLVSGAENLIGTYFYEQIDTFTIVSDTEFTVSFTEPVGAWRLLFSTIHPVIPASAYQEHLDSGAPLTEFLQTEIGFSGGPYTVVGFEPEERVSMRENPQFWGEPSNLERITLRRYDDVDQQIDALRSGDIDLTYVGLPAAAQVIEARSLDGVTVSTGAADQQFELAFNLQRAPFDDSDVRRAIAHAIDRNALTAVLVQPVTGAAAGPLNSLVHYPRQPQYTAPFARYGDLDEAERLLNQAGWTLNADGIRERDGETLTFTLIYRNTTVDLINAEGQAQTVRDQLRRVGIDVELEALGGTTYLERRGVGDWDVRLDFTVSNIDPAGVLLRFGGGHCPPSVAGCDGDPIGANFGAYSNAEVDTLIAQAQVTSDEGDRDAVFQQIDQLLADDVPALPLYEGPAFVAHVDALVGVEVEAPRGGALAHFGDWAYAADPE